MSQSNEGFGDLLDYKNCIANLPNSICRYFGVEPVGETLAIADKYLKKDYKNVVVMLLDGMGTCILENNLPEGSFLRRHLVDSYKSVFPPTTVAATTSIDCGLNPIEHAWLGWDSYYPQVDKNVTVFLNVEQGTDKPVADYSVAREYCGYESVISRLQKAGCSAHYAIPFVPPFPGDFEAICTRVSDLCKEEGKKYIYAYWSEPDITMHKCGCRSEQAKDMLGSLEKRIESLCTQLEDTLLIITADHGHVDGHNVCILDYPEICECLVRLPSIEARALNLFVKEGMDEKFRKCFNEAFGEDFILLSKQEVYDMELFGPGTRHKNVDGMIGDYVAVSITDLTVFNTRYEADNFKGVHAGYTEDEMVIPFIAVELNGGK